MTATGRTMLRETIRQILREEAALKVGDIRRALDAAKGDSDKSDIASISKSAARKLGRRAAGLAINTMPGGSVAWAAFNVARDMRDLYKKAKHIPDSEKKKNPLWDYLTLDPETADILDDDVEQDFVDWLAAKVEDMPDDAYLPNAEDQLADYLMRYYNGHYITKSGGF